MSSKPAADQWFAACPRGIEGLLAAELATLGAVTTRETVAGVYFEGPPAIGYRACLWSRLANRILKPLITAEAADGDQLYASLKAFDWPGLFRTSQRFAIDFSGESPTIRNTQYGAQRCKDAIVDRFVEHAGQRPDVDRKQPDIRLNVRLGKGRVVVSVDYSGGSLHQRGYRSKAGAAPLKENLAAAILLRADWPAMAARGGGLIDPMCGSGTLLLEGAMMAADIAPGLGRRRFGFEQLADFNAPQWNALLADARSRAERGRASQLPEMRGYDADARVIKRAEENIAAAGLQSAVRVATRPLAELKKPSHRALPHGLIVCNPPYGERLGEKRSLAFLYRQLGEMMVREFPQWQAAVFTSDLELGKAIGLRSHKRYRLYNGGLEASLLLFNLEGNRLRDAPGAPGEAAPAKAAEGALSEGAQMFANRIRKNRKRLASWVKREGVDAYRLYDADMPEYAVAVDLYGEAAHVAEYRAPKDVDPESAQRRLDEIRSALPVALDVPPERIVYKQRQRQRGASQYEKRDSRGEFTSVREGQARLLVNLHDYLDTGLFLDHRPLRLRIAAEANGKRFLNLFCYTGAATVQAALGGARHTTSVDMSNTYLDWLRKNLAHNGLGETSHSRVRANCLEWLLQDRGEYDLILLDPPSFSNSKSMADTFDVQRDHAQLVRATMARLAPDGVLYFSNNRRGFKLDPAVADDYACEDITRSTLDPDFQRNHRIHCCYKITYSS